MIQSKLLITDWKVPNKALDPSSAVVKPTLRLNFGEIKSGKSAPK